MPVCFICFVLFEHLNLLTPSKIYINLSRFYLYSNLSDNQPFYFLISWSLQTAFPGTCISYHQGLPYNFENSLISLSHLTNRLYVDFGVESHFFPQHFEDISSPPSSFSCYFWEAHCVLGHSHNLRFLSRVFHNLFITRILKFKMATSSSWRSSFIHCSGHTVIFPSWIFLSVEKLVLLLPGQFLPHCFSLPGIPISYWIICNDLPLTIFFLLLCKVFF